VRLCGREAKPARGQLHLVLLSAGRAANRRINVFGNKVSLDSPWCTAFSLWVLWGYFLVRFYQYFRIIPDKWFWNAYEQQMKKLIEASSFKHFKKEFKRSGEGERLWIRFQFCTFRDDFRKNAA
jgi:hypothetical protein